MKFVFQLEKEMEKMEVQKYQVTKGDTSYYCEIHPRLDGWLEVKLFNKTGILKKHLNKHNAYYGFHLQGVEQLIDSAIWGYESQIESMKLTF